ncbi:hypothetical protein [Micromonospora sp. DT233]|uniref:hypothetical protein n=1 Tax=Micromonospora sp. DT233 TaxID=3393432 RepID=UPI003CE9CB76
MQSVAFARPSRRALLRESRPPWQTTLRRLGELGRLALTALVLAVGLGGVSALTTASPAVAASPAPAVHAGASRPVVVTSRVDALRPGPTELRAEPAARRAPRTLETALRPAVTPLTGAPAESISLGRPAVDPTAGIVVRRGPPRR